MTNSVLAVRLVSYEALLAPLPPLPLPPDPTLPPLVLLPSWAAVRLSSAAFNDSCAWLTESWAAVGSISARISPSVTCWPTLTYTAESVPLALKFACTSVAGSTLPEPVTVVWTRPFSAVTSSREVREVLVGWPSWVIATTITAAAASARRMSSHRGELVRGEDMSDSAAEGDWGGGQAMCRPSPLCSGGRINSA
ncbi:MAG TPA: hypothetical protein VLP43_12320 [Solirubrobacteraceae bacterium]|nr:hypothetical protein [Solirubrobacteraceae bacterium]